MEDSLKEIATQLKRIADALENKQDIVVKDETKNMRSIFDPTGFELGG